MSLSFKDRVVIITGAGGGLGKVYALEYAKRGAKVVVNDLGVSLSGVGHNNRAADVVVEEIKKLGGTAIANYDSVTEGEKIVQAAIDAFGRIDVLVNNAANLRDGTFMKMSEDDFKAVIEVHLTGTYKLSKAAWPYMREQKYGRILNTASPAGLYGNFGQTNYSAAKLGQVGLAETLAKEGSKYNIKVNVIAPLARSRMTEGLLPYHILKVMGPEKVAPMVLYLTHESVPTSGKIFEPAAGYFGQVRWERSSGELFNVDDSFTAEAILEKFKGIASFKNKPFKPVEHPEQLADYNDLITKARRLPRNAQGNIKIRSLKDKVVIITGAGGGLGKSHALWFAKYGAKVVVNDIRNSEEVVREINTLYGANRAVADTHDIVTQGAAIVATALKAFGTVDILINNAGILRDRSFAKMSDGEWNAVLNVHLYSVFGLCKAVWPIFAKKKSGIIVNTTSTSGIYGNFGQANYAAAKAAVLGFSRSLALEGQRLGIKVFIIAPHAETAMTKTIFSTRELTNHFEPGLVSPFVVLLASDELNSQFRRLNGLLFEVGGGWIGHTRWQRSKAAISHGSVTPEFVRDHWSEITDFSSNTTNPSRIDEASSYILKTVGTAAGMGAMNSEAKYTHRDVILYNIGVGATAQELKYTYEHHPDFQTLPTFPIVLAMNGGTFEFGDLVENFDFTMLLHGEQYIKIMQYPIPTEANIKVVTRPVAAANKGSNAALIVIGYDVINADTNTKIAYSEGSYFVRGAKVKSQELARGFATRPKFTSLPFNAPSTAPDYEVTVATDKNQAVLYRLSGDYNPLHVDPLVAKMAGFPKPILHGLASLGFCAKQLVDKYGAFDELKVRFSDYVFPGDRLKLHSWKQSNGIIVFTATDVDRNKVVLSNAAIKLVGSTAKL